MSSLENNKRISRGAREKCQLIYEGKNIRIDSAEILKAWETWNDIFQVLRTKTANQEYYISS
jgi:hypothetical protein